METVTDFIFLGSKITADGDCSHETKRCLLLGRKAMTNLERILKSRDIILPTKVHLVKAMVFPAVMYGCESRTVKKAECRRIDAFELWCWRRLLRVPWSARRSNQSILKEISPGCSLEGMMIKLIHYILHQNVQHWKTNYIKRYGLPRWCSSKESTCKCRRPNNFIPGSGRTPGGGMATHSSILAWKIP